MRYRHRPWLLAALCPAVALAAALAAVAPGCKKKADPNQAGDKKVLIGVVGKSQSNPVFLAAHAGARDAAKELASKYGVEVTVDVRTPTDESPQQQAEAVRALTRAGAKGISVACSEAGALKEAIDDATKRGVAVMCFDSDSPESKRVSYYGTNDADAGKRLMDELAKVMGERGTVAVLAGNQDAPNLKARVAGVREALKKYPNMREAKGGNGVFYHEEKNELAAQAVNDAQRANPEIEGWVFVGGWPLFTRDALRWEPGKVKVVSMDALPEQYQYLQSGHVQMLLGQDCYGWGYKSVQILLDKVVKNQDPPSAHVYGEITPVTKENYPEFAKKWEKWLKK